GPERAVVVDVLRVLDVDAGALLELVERRMRVLLVVRVDVVRPVREPQRLRELLLHRRARGLAARAAACGQQAGYGQDRGAGRSAAEQLVARHPFGHSSSSSSWEMSTTKVASGLHERVAASPSVSEEAPGS